MYYLVTVSSAHIRPRVGHFRVTVLRNFAHLVSTCMKVSRLDKQKKRFCLLLFFFAIGSNYLLFVVKNVNNTVYNLVYKTRQSKETWT